jgi:hypothetical protein
MGARAAKNPVVASHYPSFNTPLQVTEAGPDPRPGIFNEEGDGFAKGGTVPDPSGLLTPFNGIGQKYPKGITTRSDKSLAHKGGR